MESVIIRIIADVLKVPTESVSQETKLADIAHDSIALFELLMRFEAALGANVRYEDIAHIETVGDIVRYAESLPPERVAAALSAERTSNV